jgi:hypothetical protein
VSQPDLSSIEGSLASGNVGAAIAALERLRKQAAKTWDADHLEELIALAERAQGVATKRRDRVAADRLLYAIRQNAAYARRKSSSDGQPTAPTTGTVPERDETAPSSPPQVAKHPLSRLSSRAKIVIGVAILIAVLAIIGAITGGSKKSSSSQGVLTPLKPTTTAPTAQAVNPDPTMDRNTRVYIAKVKTCDLETGIVLLQIKDGVTDPVKLAGTTTDARDICDSIRSQLSTMSTDHFYNQAILAWAGVDRMKSGLNAFLAYLDNPEPTKIIEVRDKLQEGDADISQGIAQINQRRKVYGLPPVR